MVEVVGLTSHFFGGAKDFKRPALEFSIEDRRQLEYRHHALTSAAADVSVVLAQTRRIAPLRGQSRNSNSQCDVIRELFRLADTVATPSLANPPNEAVKAVGRPRVLEI